MEDTAEGLRRRIALYRGYLREDIYSELASTYAKGIVQVEIELAEIERRVKKSERIDSQERDHAKDRTN